MKIINKANRITLQPLITEGSLLDFKIAGLTLEKLLQKRFANIASYLKIGITDICWLSDNMLADLAAAKVPTAVTDENGNILAWASEDGEVSANFAGKLSLDEISVIIRYPWDLLAVNELLVGSLKESRIDGKIRDGVQIDGTVEIGEGTVLLPGVYIEGNAVIGKNCKIGPNCYIRGNTSVGDNCHIGQAVEVKNSILLDNVSAGHLSYIGDSIIGENTNLGAGTITANYRHDAKNHRSEVDGVLLDTGRRKFGCIMGADVHTGIHTSIYPGRKIWPHKSTLPGAVVSKDLK